jgi:hypothetical protein
MKRTLAWVAGGTFFLVAATGLAMVMAETEKGSPFIPGDQPVSEAQIRQKLEAEGWSNVQIVREGRYFDAMATKEGQTSKFDVDSQTGRLHVGEDDDDD